MDRSTEDELAELEAAPGDKARAVALREALLNRCRVDAEFADLLSQWQRQVDIAFAVEGDVNNTVSGTVHGPVLQARTFAAPVTFGAPPSSAGDLRPDP